MKNIDVLLLLLQLYDIQTTIYKQRYLNLTNFNILIKKLIRAYQEHFNLVTQVIKVYNTIPIKFNTILDLIEVSKNENKELWLVGENKSDYLSEILKNTHVKYFTPTLEVDKYIHKCSETAGILLGRTTIEGWMCGKPGWIYNVDSSGNILNKNLFDIPEDIDKFKSSNVSKKIKKLYINTINI